MIEHEGEREGLVQRVVRAFVTGPLSPLLILLSAVAAVAAVLIASNFGGSRYWLFGTAQISSLAVLPLENLSGDNIDNPVSE